jgi:hypothetical protein
MRRTSSGATTNSGGGGVAGDLDLICKLENVQGLVDALTSIKWKKQQVCRSPSDLLFRVPLSSCLCIPFFKFCSTSLHSHPTSHVNDSKFLQHREFFEQKSVCAFLFRLQICPTSMHSVHYFCYCNSYYCDGVLKSYCVAQLLVCCRMQSASFQSMECLLWWKSPAVCKERSTSEKRCVLSSSSPHVKNPSWMQVTNLQRFWPV